MNFRRSDQYECDSIIDFKQNQYEESILVSGPTTPSTVPPENCFNYDILSPIYESPKQQQIEQYPPLDQSQQISIESQKSFIKKGQAYGVDDNRNQVNVLNETDDLAHRKLFKQGVKKRVQKGYTKFMGDKSEVNKQTVVNQIMNEKQKKNGDVQLLKVRSRLLMDQQLEQEIEQIEKEKKKQKKQLIELDERQKKTLAKNNKKILIDENLSLSDNEWTSLQTQFNKQVGSNPFLNSLDYSGQSRCKPSLFADPMRKKHESRMQTSYDQLFEDCDNEVEIIQVVKPKLLQDLGRQGILKEKQFNQNICIDLDFEEVCDNLGITAVSQTDIAKFKQTPSQFDQTPDVTTNNTTPVNEIPTTENKKVQSPIKGRIEHMQLASEGLTYGILDKVNAQFDIFNQPFASIEAGFTPEVFEFSQGNNS